MLVKNVVLFVLLLHSVFIAVNCYSGSAMLKGKQKSNPKSRQKRLMGLITDPGLNFYFEYNSCYALAVVVSLPLESPASRSVFLSFNFETNYYYAYFDNAQGLTPISFSYIDQPGTNSGSPSHKVKYPNSYGQGDARQSGDEPQMDSTNRTEQIDNEKLSSSTADKDIKKSVPDSVEAKKVKEKQTKASQSRKLRGLLQNYFMSRRRFFKMMETKMDSSQMNGRDCLLKAICETAAHTFGQHNGVIGSVVDILFLPSASKDEILPKRYYKAEKNGKLGDCKSYNKMCPIGLFDFITKLI